MNSKLKKTVILFIAISFITTNILIYPIEVFALSVSGGKGFFTATTSCYGVDWLTGKIKNYGESLLGKTISGGISKAKDKASDILSGIFGGKGKDSIPNPEEDFEEWIRTGGLGSGGAVGAKVPVIDNSLIGQIQGYRSDFKDFSKTQLNYKKDEKTKDRCLDSIAWQASKFLIRRMVDDTARWLRNGANGKPRFIQDFGAYLREAGDVAGGLFLEQLLGDASPLCEPWKLDIALSLPRRKGFGFDAQCRISEIVNVYNQSGINVDINGNRQDITIQDTFNDFSKIGWFGLLTANLQGNFLAYNYIDSLNNLDLLIQAEKEKRKLEAQVNKGLLLSACVKEVPNSLGGKKCLKTKITSPGEVINGALQNIFGSEIKQLEIADEINELIAATIDGIKSGRLFSDDDEGVSGFSSGGRRGGWLSDEDLLNDGDPLNDGGVFNPPDITQDATKNALLSVIHDFIFNERDYLMLKKESKQVIETEILTNMNGLIAQTKDKKTKKALKRQKEDIEKQLTQISRQITESGSLVYEKGSDPIENLLTNKYPDWTTNEEQRTAFCEEPEAVSDAIKLLPMIEAEIICAEDSEDKINELADFMENDLPLMLGAASDAASEYENVISLRNNLREQLNINPPLGSHEVSDNATCSVTGWAFDTDTPDERVNVRALQDENESLVVASGEANLERNDIADCTPDKFCGFELNLTGIATGTPISITVQAEDTSDSSWYDLSDTPKEINCF